MNNKRIITIIIPCFNEGSNIDKLINSLMGEIKNIENYNFDLLFVDDGSIDNTYEKIKNICISKKNVKCIKLSKNFGFHIAISAGIDFIENSDSIIILPADMQEPASLIHKMIKEKEKGNDIVWSIRKIRKLNFINSLFTKLFYKLFIKLTGFHDYPKEGPSAFFLINKQIYTNFTRFKEGNRMTNIMIFSMGFKQATVSYDEQERSSGSSSYTLIKKIKIAIDSIVSFSYAPIRFISLIGSLIALISFIYMVITLYEYFISNITIPGYTTLLIVILFLGGIQLLTLGILGEYLWRNSLESKKRPLYYISDKINFN